MQTDEDLIRQARGLFERGDYEGAEKAYRDLMEVLSEDKHVDLQLLIAACQQARARGDDALETLQRTVDMDDSRAESWFQLGRARRQAGDEAGATEALQKAILLDPNHALARVERGRQCLASGDQKGAEGHFQTALRADPECVPALVGLAERHFAVGRLDQAQELAAKAVQRQPRSVPAQIVMARIFRHRGHPDFAERCLDNALEVVPDAPDLHAAKAQLLFERGRLEECLDAVARAGRLGAYDGRLFRIEYQCVRRLGRDVEARSMLEALARSRSLDPGDTLALAELRLETGDPAAAGELLEGLEKDWPGAERLIRARLAEREGDRDRAAELAEGLHDDDDEHIRTQARLLSARLALKADDPAGCIDALQPLADEDSAEPKVHWMLARALDRVGRHEAAGDHLPRTGWFLPPVFRERDREMPAALYEALAGLQTDDWPKSSPDDGRPEAIFVLGWPGSGREALVAALAESGAVATLGREGGERRREALGLPAGPDRLVAADETQCRLARKRYLREAGTERKYALETMWLPAAALPAIARFLPGSTVILADAELRDLELEWRLAGFRGVETLRAMWQREQAALETMMEKLPLDFHVFSRGDLQNDSGEVAAQLAEWLDRPDPAGMAAAIDRGVATMRPSGHWKHYRQLFEGKSVA
ncbi:tetratricopeptide repeat protein [Wenzhouxiangella sp. EGI_FJ10305]|uniref:tetratricopeptide repeat protein n=1 Tax=Wenzhouxiangella sp. EGI_FJ10305 TaxID=3243768 RepID=UPI0035DD1845